MYTAWIRLHRGWGSRIGSVLSSSRMNASCLELIRETTSKNIALNQSRHAYDRSTHSVVWLEFSLKGDWACVNLCGGSRKVSFVAPASFVAR